MLPIRVSHNYDPVPPRSPLEVSVSLLTITLLLLALLYCFLLLVRRSKSATSPSSESAVNFRSLPVTRVRRVHAIYASHPRMLGRQQRTTRDAVAPREAGLNTEQAPPPYAARDISCAFERQIRLDPAQSSRHYGATRTTERCSCPRIS